MPSPKHALVTGITGQDGAYLAKLLLAEGYNVTGILAAGREPSLGGLQYLGIASSVKLVTANLQDFADVQKLVLRLRPTELYHLAAQSSVSASFGEPAMTMRVNTQPVINFLEAIRTLDRSIKFYHASSSEMYGRVLSCPIDSTTLFNPVSPYAVSKVAAHHTVRVYRESYSLFAVSGVLFNHESVLRKHGFFVRKLLDAVMDVRAGNANRLSFGNIDVRRDIGYAPDYVRAMWLMLQQPTADDFLICTGRSVALRELVEHILRRAGLTTDVIQIDPALYRPNEILDIYGDATTATRRLGWTSKYDAFETMDLIFDEAMAIQAGNRSPTR
jgi:GDPmannose 4,6-dehydratase